jgi:uncharacterized protein (DUF111 family)
MYVDSDDQRYTADVAVLHDIDGNTITLTNLDETNNVGTAGPIAAGEIRAEHFLLPHGYTSFLSIILLQ